MSELMEKMIKHLSVSYYLAALVLLIVAAPFIESLKDGGLIEAVLLTNVLLFAVISTGGGRKAMLFAYGLTAFVVVCRWLNFFWPKMIPPAWHLVFGILIINYTIYRLLFFILRAPRVNSETLCAGVAAYLTLGLSWSLSYILTAQLIPGSFSFLGQAMQPSDMRGFTALYFSFATLCTVGYGDIVPISPVARMLTISEAGAGVFYMAIMISRLVSLSSSGGNGQGETEPLCSECGQERKSAGKNVIFKSRRA